MNKRHYIFIFFVILSIQTLGQENASEFNTQFEIKGQLSTWGHFNPNNPYPFYLGGRYISQINYEFQMPKNKLIDLGYKKGNLQKAS